MIESKFKDFYLVRGTEIALQMGDVRAANVVLLGAISKFFEVGDSFLVVCYLFSNFLHILS